MSTKQIMCVSDNFLVVRPLIFYNSIGQERDRFIIPMLLTNRIVESYEDGPPETCCEVTLFRCLTQCIWCDQIGRTPLICTAELDEVVELIKAKADVNHETTVCVRSIFVKPHTLYF